MKLSDVRLAALFLVSICVLGFEIEVMRVFSVGSWSNFGSMVISIALLGFGVAGTLLTFLGRAACGEILTAGLPPPRFPLARPWRSHTRLPSTFRSTPS